MKNKSLLNECKCIHCKQKVNQINESRIYWSKLILSKNLVQFLILNFPELITVFKEENFGFFYR